jgi:hypothetical protein
MPWMTDHDWIKYGYLGHAAEDLGSKSSYYDRDEENNYGVGEEDGKEVERCK